VRMEGIRRARRRYWGWMKVCIASSERRSLYEMAQKALHECAKRFSWGNMLSVLADLAGPMFYLWAAETATRAVVLPSRNLHAIR
jgi:hypothetical protein